MKKFINVPIGGTTVLSIELEEDIARSVAAKTGNCVMFCKEHWYVTWSKRLIKSIVENF